MFRLSNRWSQLLGRDRRNGGFMSRLARDTRGNVLAMTAAAIIPLAGMIGGGIDLARMYIVKTRLQHACDAGSLAGRKAMGGNSWGPTYNAVAVQFFNGNFATNAYGSSGLILRFSEANGTVTGNASATIPMTLTRVIGVAPTQTMSVTCDARMQLPNTDVMFVLDNTDSMLEKLNQDPDDKMTNLKRAVKCFYEIVAVQNTSADCQNGTPSGGVGQGVQVRFGFVPFSTNVNVGALLPRSYFPDKWTYQSRAPSTVYGALTPNSFTGSWQPKDSYDYSSPTTRNSNSNCATAGWTSSDTFVATGVKGPNLWPDSSTEIDAQQTNAWGPSTWNGYIEATLTHVTASNVNGKCQEQTQTRKVMAEAKFSAATGTSGYPFPAWTYRPVEFSLNGLQANSSLSLQIGFDSPSKQVVNQAVLWDGCIEERSTVKQTDWDVVPPEALDLSIDRLPGNTTGLNSNNTTVDTQWRPALKGAFFPRRAPKKGGAGNYRPYATDGDFTTDTVTTFMTSPYAYLWQDWYSCPAPAQKLQVWNTSNFESYVDGLTTSWGTYHDIGLLWGARLLSPKGIFASENAATPTGGPINRTLIFMTDGDACTDSRVYHAYGGPFYDRRETPSGDVPTGGCSNGAASGTLTSQVDKKTIALCDMINNRDRDENWSLYVVYLGATGTDAETEMKRCVQSHSSDFFSAQTGDDLVKSFKVIAGKVKQLRLSN